MLILLYKYNIRGRSFKSVPSIKRKTKPLSLSDENAVFTMFNIAKTQLPQVIIKILNSKVSNYLNITEGNLTTILAFMDSIIEIDIQRNETLLAEWKLEAESLYVHKGGSKISVRPEQSKNRLRLNSHVKFSTRKDFVDGDVYERPQQDWTTITMQE